MWRSLGLASPMGLNMQSPAHPRLLWLLAPLSPPCSAGQAEGRPPSAHRQIPEPDGEPVGVSPLEAVVPSPPCPRWPFHPPT